MNNLGRILHGNVSTLPEDLLEHGADNQDGEIDSHHNYGQRIQGPWIFGLLECLRQDYGDCKSGELRLFIVERHDSQTRLPIIRFNFQPGLTIWSDQLKANDDIGRSDGFLHESVNNSENFISENGVHTKH